MAEGGLLSKSSGITLFWREFNFYHITRLLAKLGVMKTTPVVFLRVKDPIRSPHQPLGLFKLQFICNDIYHKTTKYPKSWNILQWVIWCGQLAMKSRVNAAAGGLYDIYGLYDGRLSSSGVVDSLQPGLPLGAEFERCPSRRPYPEIVPKP